jgi:hypothetical protein
MPVTRRHLLTLAAAVPVAGGLLAAGVGGTVAWQWWARPPGEGLQRLASDEHDFVQALAEAWMPAGGTPAISGSEAELGHFLDGVLAGMSEPQANELKILLQALDDLPRLTHFAPYRSLDLEARIALLDGWLHSDQWLLRNAMIGLLSLMGTGFSTHPDVLPHVRPHFKCAYGR